MILREKSALSVHNNHMLRALQKTLFTTLLLFILCGQVVHAETKIYQYDGKLPFVQMMLSMMVAMGILDRLPSYGYGGYSSFSPWSRRSSPYTRALALQGLPSSTAWGSPDWGVLPVESYTRNYYSNYYDYPGYTSAWSSTDLDGWVNEPWDSSVWNDDAKGFADQPQVQAQDVPVQQAVPLVQNFNYSVPANTQDQASQAPPPPPPQIQAPRQQRSPLARLAPPAKSINREGRQPNARQTSQQRKPSPLRKKLKQRPCVTEFCGLKKPNLNGLWVAQNGEMLGVKNHRYLWTDGDTRYLTGQIKIQNEYLLANVDGYDDKLMRFKYKLAGNHLLTMQPGGKMLEFIRVPVNQYFGNRNYYR